MNKSEPAGKIPGTRPLAAATATVPAPPKEKDATKKHIRGSSLLLIGRMVSMALNFGVQILTVRYLSKSDYGALAYALSVVSMSTSAVLFGLDKAIARFVPIYEEREDYPRMAGTVALALGTVLVLGLILVVGVLALDTVLFAQVASDPLSAALLVTIIALAPIQALEALLQGLFAVFAKPSAIFFRKNLLGPGIKLAVVGIAVLLKANVQFIAVGYLVGAMLGSVASLTLLVQIVRSKSWVKDLKLPDIRLPFRDVFSFSTPLLTTDLLLIVRSSLVVVLLEAMRSTTEVAEYKAVVPFAGLNLLVYQSFKYLYTPLASRFVERKDTANINDLYWQTAIWISVISFPIFATTVSLAEPFTVLMLGAQYAGTGVILAILAFGEYFNAAFGYNSYTLQVYGRVRYIVGIDIATAALSVGLNVLLIREFGAIGAAIGTTSVLVVYNVLNHAGLMLGTGIQLFKWQNLQVYVGIAAAAGGLLLLESTINPPLYVGIFLVALLSLALLLLNRRRLQVERFFPEILKIPVIGKLLTS